MPQMPQAFRPSIGTQRDEFTRRNRSVSEMLQQQRNQPLDTWAESGKSFENQLKDETGSNETNFRHSAHSAVRRVDTAAGGGGKDLACQSRASGGALAGCEGDR